MTPEHVLQIARAILAANLPMEYAWIPPGLLAAGIVTVLVFGAKLALDD